MPLDWPTGPLEPARPRYDGTDMGVVGADHRQVAMGPEVERACDAANRTKEAGWDRAGRCGMIYGEHRCRNCMLYYTGPSRPIKPLDPDKHHKWFPWDKRPKSWRHQLRHRRHQP